MQIRAMAATATVLLAAVAATGADAADKIKFSTFGTTKNPIVKCAWLGTAQSIADKSGGKVNLETYLGGTAFGNPRKQYDFLARGVMDMSAGILAYKQGAFPLTGLVNLPFMVTDNVKAAIGLNKVIRQHLMDEFKSIHLMFVALVSPYQFHLRQPIADLTELKGRRIRIAGKAATEALKALGAQPAPMPITQAYENLQKGVVDGIGGTWTSILAFKLGEVTSFHYEANFAVPSAFMGMSKKAYRRLPRNVQAIVDAHSTPEYAAKISNCWARTTAPAKKLAKKHGNTIVTATAADRERYRKLLSPVTERILSGLEKRGLPARRIHDEMRRAIAAEEARS